MAVMDREKWLEERRKGIGGSDAAALVGMNSYSCLLYTSLPDDKLAEYDKPVPGAAILALAPALELHETPPCLPPTLTPTLFLPIFNFTPGAILTLFLNLNPKINTP